MESNILVQYTKASASFTAPIHFQWDYGITLLVFGIPSDATYKQVHFASENQKMSFDKDLVEVGDAHSCLIPDELFMTPRDIHCFIYIGGAESGMTVLDVVIPVASRPKPSGYAPDSTIAAGYEEIYAKVNSLVDEAKAAKDGAENAQAAAEEAAASFSPASFVFEVNPEDGCLYW